jgi:hypothetical protein
MVLPDRCAKFEHISHNIIKMIIIKPPARGSLARVMTTTCTWPRESK